MLLARGSVIALQLESKINNNLHANAQAHENLLALLQRTQVVVLEAAEVVPRVMTVTAWLVESITEGRTTTIRRHESERSGSRARTRRITWRCRSCSRTNRCMWMPRRHQVTVELPYHRRLAPKHRATRRHHCHTFEKFAS
ncbi:uncharacterized protein LOC120430113 [Culex pipiens pallens]|uniref:uncharacterized protein LOC120430113 n=1 Tax=Culex pipiens pallens TaxID=42434 RepID=UPI001953B849|nr:uncharacterized protein LOC120430113 [Culex pipiens pallens]